MAGFIQSGTLIDGQWMTTNVDVNTVLERHRERKQEELQSEANKTPVFGLLTQTIIDSPVVHWILPARIRSVAEHDVAFIGVSELYFFTCMSHSPIDDYNHAVRPNFSGRRMFFRSPTMESDSSSLGCLNEFSNHFPEIFAAIHHSYGSSNGCHVESSFVANIADFFQNLSPL